MSDSRLSMIALLDAAADRTWLVSLSRRLLTTDPSSAEDVVSRAIAAAYEHPPRNESALRGWLARAVQNFASKERRERTRRDRREVAVARDEVDEVSVDEVAALEETRRRVVAAVLALPETQRSVILLHHWSGLTCKVIAARRNESESTVRNRLARAHDALRGALDADYEERATWRRALAPLVAPMPFASTVMVNSALIGGPLVATKGKLVIVAACALIGVTSLLLIDGASRESTPVNDVVLARVEPSMEASNLALVETVDPESTTRAEAATSALPAAPSEFAAHGAVHVVRVVRTDDRTPIPFAAVHLKKELGESWQQRAARFGEGFFATGDRESSLADAPVEIANEHGEIEIAIDGCRYTVGARQGVLFGTAYVDTRTPTRTTILDLDRDAEIRVFVTDAAGAPVANESVVLEWSLPGMRESHAMARADSDEHGFARLRHFLPPTGFDVDPTVRYVITLGTPYATPPEFVIPDLTRPPAEPIHLVVPESGRVDLDIVKPDGTPYDGLLAVGVRRAPAPVVFLGSSDELIWLPVRAGTTSFQAGVGAEIGVCIRAPDESIDPVRTEMVGPSSRGEAVRRTIRVGARRPMLRGRVVEASGAPLARHRVEGRFGTFEHPSRSIVYPLIDVISDETGAFSMPLPAELRASRPDRVEILSNSFEFYPDARHRAILPLGADSLHGSDVELGTIIMQTPPPIVAGRVVDASGASAGAVHVVVEFVAVNGSTSEFSSTFADEDGNFDVRDWFDGEAERVQVRAFDAGRFLVESPEVELGATGVVLRLDHGSQLEGSMNPGGGVDLASVVVTLDIESSTRNSWVDPYGRARIPDAKGFFAFSDVPPGIGALEIRDAKGSNEPPIARIEGLTLAAGVTNRDSRVQGIALANLARRLDIEIVDEAGRPIEGARLRLRSNESGSGPSRDRVTDFSGRGSLVIPRESHSLVVTKWGYRIASLPFVDSSHRVTLLPAIEVRVAIDAVRSEHAHYEVRMMPAVEDPSDETLERWSETGQRVSAAFGPDGKATFFAVEPGEYTLAILRELASGRFAIVHERPCVISESDSVHEFVIDFADGGGGSER